MSSSILDRTKGLVDQLSDDDRRALLRYLRDMTAVSAKHPTTTRRPPPSAPQPNIVWLKKNRERYAGQFVALIDGQLVGSGATLRQAREQAASQGAKASLIMRVTAANEALPGGL